MADCMGIVEERHSQVDPSSLDSKTLRCLEYQLYLPLLVG